MKRFLVADFQNTRLDDCSISAGLSLDALYLAEEPAAVLRELRRVMLPKAPLIFTYYSSQPEQLDWSRSLKDAGFDALKVTDITIGWREHMRQKHQRRWVSRYAIREALGDFARHELSVTASMLGLGEHKSFIESTFRYFIHAVRQ